MNRFLLLTLGHNSSAIFIDHESNITIGYEQERLDGIKSSSAFPIDAINEIIKHCDIEGSTVLVSHWFNSSDVDIYKLQKKYYNANYMYRLEISYNLTVRFLNYHHSFSHHDAHMYSSLSFLDYYKNDIKEDFHFIVADGFGNDQEVLSIYHKSINSQEPVLLRRVYGYNNSLGLMYQYATSFCAMKENQDEYKFLGYENLIDTVENIDLDRLAKNIDYTVSLAIKDFNSLNNLTKPHKKLSTIIDFESLKETKENWYSVFRELIKNVNNNNNDIYNPITLEEKRIIIGYFIQSVIEEFFKRVIDIFGIKNLCVSGGCFYNVKLNNSLLKKIPGYFCAVPLAGDQGCGIGYYYYYNRINNTSFNFNWSNLSIGKRDLYGIEKYHNIFVFDKKTQSEEALEKVYSLILNNNLVSIIDGSMEFGPRALCNTSTIFLPTIKNSMFNNAINDRNEVMPHAPVMLKHIGEFVFDKSQINKVIGSDKFMIVTYDFLDDFAKDKKYSGCIHQYPLKDLYSGRPQMIDDEHTFIYKILKKLYVFDDVKCLINTSYNFHGVPICFNTKEIMHTFSMQQKSNIDETNNFLVVLK